MLDIRVTTPDGHVWHVRRRWARRRALGRRHSSRIVARRQAAWRIRRQLRDANLGQIGYVNVLDAIRGNAKLVLSLVALGMALLALVVGGLGRWTARVAAPWAAAHPADVLGVLAVGVVTLAAVLVHRPWVVEAERQGLDDAPRQVWRVVGWRRSGRWAVEVAQAIGRGWLDGAPVDQASERPAHGRSSRDRQSDSRDDLD